MGSAPRLTCTIAILQMESGRATPTRTCTIEIRDLLRRISVIRVPLSVIRVPLPEDQKGQEEETGEEEEEEEEAEREIHQRMYHKTLVSLTCGADM